MRSVACSLARPLAGLSLGLMLMGTMAGCGEKKQEGGSTTQMKDLEVVDGSTNDAMTDLDGVRSEGTAMIETATNASAAARPAAAGNASNAAASKEGPSEVVAEQ